jgi:hypothetical protein
MNGGWEKRCSDVVGPNVTNAERGGYRQCAFLKSGRDNKHQRSTFLIGHAARSGDDHSRSRKNPPSASWPPPALLKTNRQGDCIFLLAEIERPHLLKPNIVIDPIA